MGGRLPTHGRGLHRRRVDSDDAARLGNGHAAGRRGCDRVLPLPLGARRPDHLGRGDEHRLLARLRWVARSARSYQHTSGRHCPPAPRHPRHRRTATTNTRDVSLQPHTDHRRGHDRVSRDRADTPHRDGHAGAEPGTLRWAGDTGADRAARRRVVDRDRTRCGAARPLRSSTGIRVGGRRDGQLGARAAGLRSHPHLSAERAVRR